MPFLHPAAVGSGRLAAEATDFNSQWYVYRAATGDYYGVDWQTGLATYTHATAADDVVNSCLGAMDSSTTATVQSGGLILVGPGIFNVAAPAVLNKYGITMEGLSPVQATIFKQNAALGSGRAVIEIGTSADAAMVQSISLRNIHITGAGASHSGERGLNVWGSDCTIENVTVQETYGAGIYCSGSTNHTAFQNKFITCSVINFGHGDTAADGFVFTNTVSDTTLLNLESYQGDDDSGRGQDGFGIAGAGGMMAFGIHAWNCNRHGLALTSNGDGSFIGGQFESNVQKGIFVSGADDNLFLGCNIYANGINQADGGSTEQSITLSNAERNRFIGCRLSKVRPGNTTTTVPNIDTHVQFGSGSHRNIMIGCQVNDADTAFMLITGNYNIVALNEFGPKKTYSGTGSTAGRDPDVAGIRLSSTATGNLIAFNHIDMGASTTKPAIQEVTGMTGTGNRYIHNTLLNSTGIGLLGGIGTVIRDNVGYVTENWGTGRVDNTQTTEVISHGLATTPTVVFITLAENPTNDPPVVWVDTLTSTQFTVNCADPGASNLDFYWYAKV